VAAHATTSLAAPLPADASAAGLQRVGPRQALLQQRGLRAAIKPWFPRLPSSLEPALTEVAKRGGEIVLKTYHETNHHQQQQQQQPQQKQQQRGK
jgi:hypothetical protein